MQMEQKYILGLTQELMKIRTDPENKPELRRAFSLVRKQLKGFQVEVFEQDGYRSLLAYSGKRRPKKFGLILNGHLDVIPGKPQQYSPSIRGRRLYGVGSMDMKASVACMLTVFKATAATSAVPLGLQIVTDEEIGGFHGTKLQVDSGVDANFVIAGESTGFNIVHAAKGVLQLEVQFHGKTAHGAYPWRGDNAVLQANKYVDRILKEIKNPSDAAWRSSCNVASVQTSNQSFNKIPDSCDLKLDIRFIAKDERRILTAVRKHLPPKARLNIYAHEPALNTDKRNVYLRRLKGSSEKVLGKEIHFTCAQGTSDARHFQSTGAACIEFGPSGGGIGTDNEWVNIPSLWSFCNILRNFIASL
jgi:succinyl-diaminopimelate desuccinylase